MCSILSGRLNVYFTLAVAVLIIGVTIDLGLIQPSLREVRQLNQRKVELLNSVNNDILRGREKDFMAKYYNVNDLTSFLHQTPIDDPLNYVGQVLDQARLARLELTYSGSTETDYMRRTKFTLRVLGTYSQILDFVRMMEQGKRLATVDVLSIETVMKMNSLEGRFSVSIYDPLMRS